MKPFLQPTTDNPHGTDQPWRGRGFVEDLIDTFAHDPVPVSFCLPLCVETLGLMLVLWHFVL